MTTSETSSPGLMDGVMDTPLPSTPRGLMDSVMDTPLPSTPMGLTPKSTAVSLLLTPRTTASESTSICLRVGILPFHVIICPLHLMCNLACPQLFWPSSSVGNAPHNETPDSVLGSCQWSFHQVLDSQLSCSSDVFQGVGPNLFQCRAQLLHLFGQSCCFWHNGLFARLRALTLPGPCTIRASQFWRV
eukprot:CAMPEP_0184299844 /NCGR_PEP_ID=MMETSP1049-20130417/10380_1 /TAXON_ID=77928 /ORGANISM="Proteomonas sulcata, Strain CCMP704" /LENGTH=187 /DNA_ID=CAMNT_0026610401 /DNA_START=305 /DNA_END=868 /DNA_ORIENTATION=-